MSHFQIRYLVFDPFYRASSTHFNVPVALLFGPEELYFELVHEGLDSLQQLQRIVFNAGLEVRQFLNCDLNLFTAIGIPYQGIHFYPIVFEFTFLF